MLQAVDQRAGDDSAVLQHVFQVHQVAVMHVLRVVVGVVEVDDALVVRGHDVFRQKHAHGQVLRDLAGHVVALDRVDRGVLVGVLLLDLFVVAFDQRHDLVVGRVLLALQALNVAIDDVLARDFEAIELHDLVFDEVLDLLDGDGMARFGAGIGDVLGRIGDLTVGQTLRGGNLRIGGGDRVFDLGDVELDFRTVALDDLHGCAPLPFLPTASRRCLNCVVHGLPGCLPAVP